MFQRCHSLAPPTWSPRPWHFLTFVEHQQHLLVASSSPPPRAFFSPPVTPSGHRNPVNVARLFWPLSSGPLLPSSPWSASPAPRSAPPRWRQTSRRPRGVWWASPPHPRSARSPCWTSTAPDPAATPRPRPRPGKTGVPPGLKAHARVRPDLFHLRTIKTRLHALRDSSPSRRHSHLSSHLSIISFLLSVNCNNFSLICGEEAWITNI